MELGDLSPADAAAIAKRTGLNVTGYRRVLDSADAVHVLKKHGDRRVEASRKPPQRAVTATDLRHIPRIARPENIASHRPAKSHTTARIVYVARIGRSEYHYVEQVRTGRKQLSLKTFYKRRI